MSNFKMDSDFKVEIMRGHGPGGQHKNKVETCVKITYTPLGISETCQDSRSKLKNFELAKSRLLKRIGDILLDRDRERTNEMRNDSLNSGRVRTYNFKTGICTDHKSGKKVNLNKVLNGDIELTK